MALTVVVLLFAGLCFYSLAPWQLGKNGATEARNNRISSSATAAPVPWGELVTAGAVPAADTEWRRVSVTGTYLDADQVLARLRTVEGHPAYEVLTPLRVTDGPNAGATVLVDRGYVRPVQGTQAPTDIAPAPTGTVSLAARLRQDEAYTADRGVADGTGSGAPQVYSVNAELVGGLASTAISPGYLQLDADQPGVLGALPLPQLDGGPYLSYGLQWIAFGIMAPLGLAYFVRAELRERRADRAARGGDDTPTPPERDGRDGGPVPGTGGRAASPLQARRRRGNRAKVAAAAREGSLLTAPAPAVPADRGQAMADRYGKRR